MPRSQGVSFDDDVIVIHDEDPEPQAEQPPERDQPEQPQPQPLRHPEPERRKRLRAAESERPREKKGRKEERAAPLDSLERLSADMQSALRRRVKPVLATLTTQLQSKGEHLQRVCTEPTFAALQALYGVESADLPRLKAARETTLGLLDDMDVGYCRMCKQNGRVSLACYTPRLPCGCRVCDTCVSRMSADGAVGDHDPDGATRMAVKWTLQYSCPYCRGPFTRTLCCNVVDAPFL